MLNLVIKAGFCGYSVRKKETLLFIVFFCLCIILGQLRGNGHFESDIEKPYRLFQD